MLVRYPSEALPVTEPFTNWRYLSVTRLQGMEHRHPTEQHTVGDRGKPVVPVQ